MTDTNAPTRILSPRRIELLARIIDTAVDHQGYGFIDTIEYECDTPEGTYAVIRDRYLEEEGDYEAYVASETRLDHDTVAKGLGVIRNAVLRTVKESKGWVSLYKGVPSVPPRYADVLHNAATGERLYMSEENRKRILKASRENEAGGHE